MNGSLVLLARIEALLQDLTRVRDALNSTAIDPALRKGVQTSINALIANQEKALGGLREQVVEAGRGEEVKPLAEAWKSFQETRLACTRLFGEGLAFLGGVLVRKVGIGQATCEASDVLMRELHERTQVSWAGRTILGEGASWDRLADIVRVSFPEFSVWTLPVVGHEFGHLVARKLVRLTVFDEGQDEMPVQDILEQEGRGSTAERRLQEHFADVFATYAHGPAYLCSAVLLRFDPSKAYIDQGDHPADAKRVYAMLRTLDRLQEGDPFEPHESIIRQAGTVWTDCLAVAGEPPPHIRLDSFTTQQLDARVDQFLEILTQNASEVRYDGLPRAQRLARSLTQALKRDDSPMLVPEQEDGLADVINAAWLWRIFQRNREESEVRWVDDACRTACQGMLLRQGR